MVKFAVRKAIVWGYIVAVALICFFAFYTYRNLRLIQKESSNVSETLRSLLYVEHIMDAMQDIETGQRGFLLTGDTGFLEPFESGLHKFSEDSARIAVESFTDKERRDSINRLVSLARNKIVFAREAVRLRDSAGINVARVFVIEGTGKRLMDSIRSVVAAIELKDRALLQENNRVRQTQARRTNQLFLLLTFLFLAVSTVFYFLVRRDIRKRMGKELSDTVASNTLQFKDILERINEGILAVDKKGVFTFANSRAYDLLKREGYDFVGKNITVDSNDLFSDDFIRMFEFSTSTLQMSSGKVHCNKTGNWYDVQIYPSKLGTSIYFRDITEEINAEQELDRIKERLEIFKNATDDVLWEYDITGDKIWWNQNFYTKFGYNPGDLPDRGEIWEKLVHPEDRPEVIRTTTTAMNDPSVSVWSDEYRFRAADNTYYHVFDRCFIMRNDEGKPIRLIGSMADITQLIQTRTDLRKIEDKYRVLVEEAGDGITVSSVSGELLEVNRRMTELTGYNKQEIINKKASEFFDAEELAVKPFRYTELMLGKDTITERILKRKNGDLVPVEITSHMLDDKIISIIRDISERKQRENALRASEQKHSALINTIDGIVWEADATTFNFTFVSKKAEKIIGYPVDQWLNEDGFWTKHMHPDDIEKSVRYCKSCVDNLKDHEFEYRVYRPDGSIIWLRDIVTVVSENGKPSVLRGIMVDITERKNAEITVKASEERYRTLVDQASDGIFISDFKGKFISVNPSGVSMSQYSHEELRNMSIFDFVVEEDVEKNPFRIAELLTGRTVRSERLMRRKDGSIIDVEITAKLLTDGRMLVFVKDISEKKKAEQLLLESEERYRAMIANLPGFVYRCLNNSEFTPLFLSYGVFELLGYYPDDYYQGKINLMQNIHPDDRPIVEESISKAIEQNTSYEINYRFLTVNGSIRHVWERGRGIFDAKGNLNYLEGFVTDVTKNKEAELALKESEETRRMIMNSALDAIITTDSNGNIREWTAPAERIFGWHRMEIIGKNISDTIIAPQHREAHNRGMERYRADGSNRLMNRVTEMHAIDKNGRVFPIELSIVSVNRNNSKFFCAFIRDITERKKSEEEIIKARKMADSLIDSLPGVFYFFDDTGKFIRWNKQLEEVTGYSSEEIAEMRPQHFFAEEDREYITGRIMTVFEKGFNDAEAPFLTKDGKIIPHYFKAVRMEYEGKPCLLGSGVDISERKKTETELKESEKKYKYLFEKNPLSMWMYTIPEFTLIDVNDAALTQYGYTKDEFLSLSLFELRPEEEHSRYASHRTPFKRGKISYEGIWKHKKKDGTIIFVDIITNDLIYNGKDTRIVLANNVTEKYIAQEKLKESYEAIRKLTDHIQNVREEERTHIAREIHDELGQQLTVLKMDVSWLKKKIGSDEAPVNEKLKSLTQMLDGTVRTVRRLSSELRPSLLDDLGLIATIDWHLKEFGKRTGIETDFSDPAGDIQLREGIKTGLFRIFQESLTNVARHAEATRVSVALYEKNGYLILRIEDNGNGFDINKIAGKRTLGLLGMKERTAMMGGSYEINSSPSNGTTVVVSVPLN